MSAPTPRVGGYGQEDPLLWVAGVAATIGLHGIIGALVVIGTMHSNEQLDEELEPKMIAFEQVELLALGEQKPADAMPRIANPAPRTKKLEAVNLAAKKPDSQAPEPPKEEDAKPEEEPRQKMLDALSDLNDPSRPSNDDLPEGDAQGVVGGSLSDAAMANMMGTYQAKLVATILSAWTVPTTLSDDEVKALQDKVAVSIRLAGEGHIVSYRWGSKSGNDQFDQSVERVIQRFQVTGGAKTLPLPENPEVRAIVLREGLNLKSWEYTGR